MSLDDRIRELHASGVSRTRAAELIGVTRPRLDWMIEALGLHWPKKLREGQIIIDGIKDTWVGHSKRTGVSVSSLRWKYRKSKGMAVAPISDDELARFVEMRKAMPAVAAAEILGRSYNQLHANAKERVPGYLESFRKLPRFRRQFSLNRSQEFLSSKEEFEDEAA